MVLPVLLILNSLANFTLCASPPDKVVADCPNFMYPNPTSYKVFNFLFIVGIAPKKSSASSTVISNT